MRHVRAFAGAAALLGLSLAGSTACLDRPISVAEPSSKASVLITAQTSAVDKVDLLLMIDNSASMADKQEILAEAVPDLIQSLVLPSCVGEDGKPNGLRADPSAAPGRECSEGKAEFAPVVDLHVGIVSSSMGGLGGDQCGDKSRPDERDGGRLVARGPNGAAIEGIGASKFLAWLPSVDRNKDKPRLAGAPPIGELEVLKKSAKSLVEGVGDRGCGLEAQLESVYHFLNEPAPYAEVKVDDGGKASLAGLDNELLAQRAAFLRPDSLVAVVMLTDEDDSQVDPVSYDGFGHFWARTIGFGGNPNQTTSRGTSICAGDPSSADCLACVSQKANKSDPECQKNGGFYGPKEDQMNVRFHKMKSRFGVDPQHPLERYRDGLAKTTVPNRAGNGTCRNPLFASALPTGGTDENDDALCNLPASRRRPEEIFFAVLGGVPNDLLHFDPADPSRRLSDDEWDKIVGKDADHYARDEGIDPRMVQSVAPRAGRPAASSTSGDNFVGSEPRDWDTRGMDLQYACTFPLRTERTCNAGECDCNDPRFGSPPANPPLCGATGKTQLYAKAYPTPRELRVARLLGKQGIAASLCPISLEANVGGAPNPLYGYRPAMATILDRLKSAFGPECLPQPLPRDDDGKVACVAILGLPGKGRDCGQEGFSALDPAVADSFLRRKREVGDTTYDDRTLCAAPQIGLKPGETCKESTERGYCYVENGADRRPLANCSQALVFSRALQPPKEVTTDLACIRQDTGLE